MMNEPVIEHQSKWNQKSSQLNRSSPQEPLFLHYVSFKAANFKILSKGETGVQLASLWEQVTEFTKNMFLPHQTDAITEAQSMLEPALHVWVF